MRDEMYGIPIWAFAGSSDSKVVDAQAGAEAMFSILTAMQSRCNVIHDVGYLEFGTTSSLEMLVLCDELVQMAEHFTKGIPVDQESLALEVIERVALGGGSSAMFLADPHTADNFREAHFLPDMLDRWRFDRWTSDGGLDAYQRCNQRAKELLAEHEVEPKPGKVLARIQEILEPGEESMAS
jgi:trimethylamine--corrinoid protein Co-methyltransferase